MTTGNGFGRRPTLRKVSGPVKEICRRANAAISRR
jgi:hypothetical protein